MAEQEVIKHTKKVYKIWNSKEHSFWYKLKESVVEVMIIVFAIILSIWLHNRSEHNAEQADVKEFLLGLRSDLTSDIKEMEADKQSYLFQSKTFSYITSQKIPVSLSNDSLKKYNTNITNATWLVPNNGRLEGFKSSGKIGTIEDYDFQNDIMDLYQEDIPSLLNSTSSYIEVKKELWQYIRVNLKQLTDSTSNLAAVLATNEAQNICRVLANTDQTIGRYDICINKMKKIINRIEAIYHLPKK